jgi:small-conductance mechanosensitive channel
MLLAWLIARPLKSKLSATIVERNIKHIALGRFLYALEQTLTYVIAVILLWLALVVFRQFGLKTHLLNLFESLLTAWVVIRLITSIVREAHWAKLIAFTAWTVAALHILSLLNPTLALLDKLAITVGDTRLSVLLLIKAIIILFVLMRLASSFSILLEKRISILEGLSPSMKVLLSKATTITLTVMAVLITMSSLGIDLYAFAFIGGAVGVGIGFGLQKVVSNLFSGLILLLDRSIKPGDVIAIDDTYGQIRTMGARYVSIVTRDSAEYLVPNEDLITNKVVNWSFSTKLIRVKISVGVSYGSDVHKVMCLLIPSPFVS